MATIVGSTTMPDGSAGYLLSDGTKVSQFASNTAQTPTSGYTPTSAVQSSTPGQVSSGGSVLSANTGPSGGSGPSGRDTFFDQNLQMTRTYQDLWDEQARREQEVRSGIESGYNDYFSTLDNMLGGLSGQKGALETQANSQYNSGLIDLTGQKTSGMQDIQGYRTQATGNQEKSLRTLADDMQNQLQAANVFLGARGAGDSSAANQYSYALTKSANKQRGSIMNTTSGALNDLNLRESKLNEIFNSESAKLKESLNSQIAGIANWFYQQQNSIQQAKAQGQLSKGQDLANLSRTMLQNAMQGIANLQANYQAQNNALTTWAMNNSQNIAQLKQNMQSVSQYQVPNVTPSPINGSIQANTNGGLTAPFGFNSGSTQDQQKRLASNNLLLPGMV